jgi:hypothetical protein
MVLGRLLFGLGGESLGITSSIVQIVWFSGNELSFASVSPINKLLLGTHPVACQNSQHPQHHHHTQTCLSSPQINHITIARYRE